MSVEAPSQPEFAYAPAPVQRRGLGRWALGIGLIAPLLSALVFGLLWLAFSTGGVDPWSLLALFLLSALVLGILAVVTGILAIVLGAVAVRRRRGRGPGIAGIVLGSLSISVVLSLSIPPALSLVGAY